MKVLTTRLVFIIVATGIVFSNYAMAAKPKPDISSDGLKLGSLVLTHGDSKTVSAKQADFHTNRRCMFEASYVTRNTGKADASVKFVNILKRNGKLVRRNTVSQLKTKEKKQHKFLLSLESGENHLELILDSSGKVDESQEKNNTISSSVKINGRCAGKQRAEKKAAK